MDRGILHSCGTFDPIQMCNAYSHLSATYDQCRTTSMPPTPTPTPTSLVYHAISRHHWTDSSYGTRTNMRSDINKIEDGSILIRIQLPNLCLHLIRDWSISYPPHHRQGEMSWLQIHIWYFHNTTSIGSKYYVLVLVLVMHNHIIPHPAPIATSFIKRDWRKSMETIGWKLIRMIRYCFRRLLNVSNHKHSEITLHVHVLVLVRALMVTTKMFRTLMRVRKLLPWMSSCVC